MKVIVCGTRGCVSNDVLWNLSNELSQLEPHVVVHGDCPNSADKLAEQWAWEHGVLTDSYPADWEAHGKSAGFIRNAVMAEVEGVGHCVAVWDGKSNGTLDMMKQAVKNGIYVTVIPAKLP